MNSEKAPAPAVSCAGGNMKFGHFTAGGDVTIHYHELPDEFMKAMKMLKFRQRGRVPCSGPLGPFKALVGRSLNQGPSRLR